MSRKGCVPNSRSNYDNVKKYTIVFNFPSDPEKNKIWIKKLPRKMFTPCSTAAVCIQQERFITREDRIQCSDGSELVEPWKTNTLFLETFPTIFLNAPKYLTKNLPLKRKDPDEHMLNTEKIDVEQFNEWYKKDIIASFEDFIDKIENKIDNKWLRLFRDVHILLYKLKETDIPKINVFLKIFWKLIINNLIDINSFKCLLGNQHKCDKWSKFQIILNKLNCYN